MSLTAWAENRFRPLRWVPSSPLISSARQIGSEQGKALRELSGCKLRRMLYGRELAEPSLSFLWVQSVVHWSPRLRVKALQSLEARRLIAFTASQSPMAWRRTASLAPTWVCKSRNSQSACLRVYATADEQK